MKLKRAAAASVAVLLAAAGGLGSTAHANTAGATSNVSRDTAIEAHSAAASPSFTSSDCIDGSDKPYATGLPVLPCRPAPGAGVNLEKDGGTRISSTVTQVQKAKITISLPPTIIRAFYTICIYPQASTNKTPPCPVDLHFPTPEPNDSSKYNGIYFGIAANAWVASPEGVSPQYGVFPPVKVGALAFGTIPVTATVHISQPVSDGISTPLSLNWYATGTRVTAGLTIPGNSQYGAAPSFQGQGAFWSPPANLSGPVDIRVDNVKVDNVPLSVGARCGTSTTLNLGSPGGFYSADSFTFVPMRGKPGAYSPEFDGDSYLDGKLDVPAFTHCRNGSEDLDPLLTALVSGPNNAINVTQSTALIGFACTLTPTDPNCDNEHPATPYSKASGASTTQQEATTTSQFTTAQLRALPPSLRRLAAGATVAKG